MVWELGLVEDNENYRGYEYDMREDGKGNLYGGHVREVLNKTTSETGGVYQPSPPLPKSSKLRTTFTKKKMMNLQ